MRRRITPQWGWLERRSPALFLAAGVLLVGYAARNGIVATTGAAGAPGSDVLGPAGFVLGFVGLLGLYPALVDRRPALARVGAGCATLGAVGFAAITLHGLAAIAGVASPSVPGGLLLAVAVGMLAGYPSFAAATRRGADGARTVGLLLVLPAVVFGAMLSQPFVYGALGVFSESTMAWSNVGISSAQALAHLAIGYTLRARRTPTVRDDPVADGAAG